MKPDLRILAALTVSLALGVTACTEPVETPVAPGELLELGADMVQFGMVSFLTASGVREGRVQADTAYAWNDSSKVALRGMNVVFYDEDGRPRVTITARRGEMNERTDQMVAREDVVLVVHEDGRRIESPELHYDPDRDRLWSDSATVQTLNGRVTRGTSFESDLEFRNFRLANPRGDIGQIVF